MFISQTEESADPHIIALVELDMRKMRFRVVLAREAIYRTNTGTGTFEEPPRGPTGHLRVRPIIVHSNNEARTTDL